MKILAVDDDPIILEILLQFAEVIGGHSITTALSGAEALELIEKSTGTPFDCFLFDIQMPLMDGIELTRTVRRIKRHADTPILMLTAMSDKRYVDDAFSAGATDYLTKPFEISELKARLTLVEGLVHSRKARTGKIFATQSRATASQVGEVSGNVQLHEPVPIYDVDNVIDYIAMENYVRQLSRSSMFGSTTFAFTIRNVEEHHTMSPFEFTSLISDVAEIISDTLAGHQFLMSYAGGGTFVCVTESGWRPAMPALMDAVNLALSRTELYNNSGEQLYVRVSAGEAIRLIWKSADSVMDAVAAAYTSAEEASARHERAKNDFWLVEPRANF